MIDVLNDDALESVVGAMRSQRDLQSIASVRSVCQTLSPVAKCALSRVESVERIGALVYGTLPEPASAFVEREAAAALMVPNLLGADLIKALYALANEAIAMTATAWTLSSELAGADDGNDRSFKLRGFDSAPLAELPAVIEWHETHVPQRPLARRDLPCVLAGPPRYLALAGSQRQQREVRRVPMELCRIIGEPASAVRGATLITALLEFASRPVPDVDSAPAVAFTA